MTIQMMPVQKQSSVAEEIHVSQNMKYIFVGPRRNEQHFCFQCLKDRFQEVEMYHHYFSYSDAQSFSDYEKDIISILTEKLDANKDTPNVYILDRETNEIEIYSTFKRDDCAVCSDDHVDVTHKKANGVFTKSNLRLESFNQVKSRIEKFKTLLYASKASLINQLVRTEDSYATPMVQSEVLYKDISMLSFGRTAKYDTSKYTSILESMERYATAFPYHSKERKPLKEDESEKIDLTLGEMMELNNYWNDQEYNQNIPIYYSEVEAVHKDENVLIPEQLIYFNSHQVTGEHRFIYESSNGSAIGSTLEEASLHAMLELIERDAFLATWYGKIPPVRLKVKNMESHAIDHYIQALQRKGIKAHIFEVSMEVKIPTIWVLLEKENPKSNEMAFYTAASTSFDLKDAIEKALIEATTAISVFENVFKKDEYQKRKYYLLENPGEVSRLEDHLLLYSNIEMRDVLSFALDTTYSAELDKMEDYYDDYTGRAAEVIERLHEQLLTISSKVYRAAVKNPNLTTTGFVNVKYIVPEILTMTFGHQHKRVVYPRLEKATRFKSRGELDINWIENNPHPFP